LNTLSYSKKKGTGEGKAKINRTSTPREGSETLERALLKGKR